jgi:hypothetical protein
MSSKKLPYVLGAPASLIGSELSSLLGFGPSLCPPRCCRGYLMYDAAASLPSLYIRNIMPDDMGIPF